MDSHENVFQPMTTTPSAQAAYLRTILTQEIQQKVRMEDLISQYEKNIMDTTETIIDENELKLTVESRPASAEKTVQLAEISDRLNTLTKLKTDMQNFLAGCNVRRGDQIDLQQSHLIELTDLEMAAGGFVAHLFGLRGDAKFDSLTNTLSLPPQSSAATGIATHAISWKDSSQLTIIRKDA